MSRNKLSQLDHTIKIGHKLTVLLCALLISTIGIVSNPSLSSAFAQSVQIQPDSTLEHDQIEIGKSVTWTQTVQVPDTVASLAVEIPSDASNVSIETSTNNAIDSSRVSASKEQIPTENATDQLSLSANKEPALAPLADAVLQGDGDPVRTGRHLPRQRRPDRRDSCGRATLGKPAVPLELHRRPGWGVCLLRS